MCEKCPKEICKVYREESYIFKGQSIHINPPCWRSSINLFEIELNEDTQQTLYVTKKTLSEAITYVLELKDTTIEDSLRLTKIRNMI